MLYFHEIKKCLTEKNVNCVLQHQYLLLWFKTIQTTKLQIDFWPVKHFLALIFNNFAELIDNILW